MQLINTEGMAIIGPGSEWLWAALSGVVTAVTLIAIFRQLRLQADAAAVEQVKSLDREWLGSERIARMKVAVLLAIRDGTDPADVPRTAMDLNDFWEAIGQLVRSGNLSIHLVNEQRSQSVRLWWGWLAPVIKAERVRRDAPWIGQDFEWLSQQMSEMDRKAGRTTSFDDAYLTRMLPSMLEYNLDVVRLAEELRTVIVRPMSTTTPEPEAPPTLAGA
jgi:hypothetical protein